MGTTQSIEVELDSRQRLPLARVVQENQRRFRVDVQAGGELLLTPVVSISERELAMLKDPQAMASLQEGIEDVRAGRVVRFEPGHFSKLAADLDDEEE
jgi:hypothetical protein